jgi:HEAT repeat protein
VAAAAIVALGLLGDPGVEQSLSDIMNDVERSRRLVDELESKTDQNRAFAAIALGLIATPRAHEALVRQLTGSGSNEVRIAAAVGAASGTGV